MKTVIFDFDNTITTRDTLRPFASYLACKNKSGFKLFLFYIVLVAYKLGLASDKSMKEFFLKFFIRGMDENEAGKVARSFFEEKLRVITNESVFEKLQGHVSSGDSVYIVSANFDFFLKPLEKTWRLSGIIATETEKNGVVFTGKIIGNTCKGRNKTERIKVVLGADGLKDMIAYGDSEDSDLLKSVGHGIKV